MDICAVGQGAYAGLLPWDNYIEGQEIGVGKCHFWHLGRLHAVFLVGLHSVQPGAP